MKRWLLVFSTTTNQSQCLCLRSSLPHTQHSLNITRILCSSLYYSYFDFNLIWSCHNQTLTRIFPANQKKYVNVLMVCNFRNHSVVFSLVKFLHILNKHFGRRILQHTVFYCLDLGPLLQPCLHITSHLQTHKHWPQPSSSLLSMQSLVPSQRAHWGTQR